MSCVISAEVGTSSVRLRKYSTTTLKPLQRYQLQDTGIKTTPYVHTTSTYSSVHSFLPSAACMQLFVFDSACLSSPLLSSSLNGRYGATVMICYDTVPICMYVCRGNAFTSNATGAANCNRRMASCSHTVLCVCVFVLFWTDMIYDSPPDQVETHET